MITIIVSTLVCIILILILIDVGKSLNHARFVTFSTDLMDNYIIIQEVKANTFRIYKKIYPLFIWLRIYETTPDFRFYTTLADAQFHLNKYYEKKRLLKIKPKIIKHKFVKAKYYTK